VPGRAALSALKAAAPLIRAAERQAVGGLSAYLLCRHRHIDTLLRSGLQEGVEQVLILGAGYDSRAYRFAHELRGRPVHEVDLAPLSRRKAAIVAAHPELFGETTIRRVETDFRTQSLAERLLASGFAVGARTFVVWEGVAPYLTRDAVAATLDALRELCGTGSVLAMDHWDGTGGTGRLAPARRVWVRSVRLIGEPITFGLRPNVVGEFLDAYGFTLLERLSAAELAARYATDGRPSHESLYLITASVTARL
jgi:methyltransferase (TIGR00027 family)